MSANTTVDIGATSLFVPSITTGLTVASGAYASLSGTVVGQWVDMRNCDTLCNVFVTAGPCSGPIGIAVQTAPGVYDVPLGNNSFSGNVFSGGAPLSGNFTDPTSGLAQLPTWFSSGGILWLNSGLVTVPGQLGASGQLVAGYAQGSLPFGPNPVYIGQNGTAFVSSGSIPEFASGGCAFAAFQRNYQYVRLLLLSGATTVPSLAAGLISQLMTTGSGGGYAQTPFPTNLVNV